MRRLIFISFLIILIFTACQYPPIFKTINYYGYDLRTYAQKGFLFVVKDYDKEFDSIGFISIEIFPSASTDGRGVFFYDKIKYEEALDSLYVKANEMGANAITRFEITTIYKRYAGGEIPGVQAGGYAIKRK